MLKRDYIMRLIRELAEALELLLKKDTGRQREEIGRMYGEFVGPADFYRTAPMDDVMDSFARFAPDERLQRMEMLAELYYAEAGMAPGPAGGELLRRSLALFGFIDSHDRTFSIGRRAKMADISKRLAGAEEGGSATSGAGGDCPADGA